MWEPGQPPANVARLLAVCLAILAASLVWTVVIPGAVAHQGGVFYASDMRARLRDAPDFALDTYELRQKERKELAAKIQKAIEDAAIGGDGQALPGLLAARHALLEEERTAVPPIAAIPFHLNPQLLLWPAIYTCLGWLIVVFRPTLAGSVGMLVRRRAFWVLFMLLYAIYEWPLWMRNFVLRDDGRKVFAYPNFDVHASSFVAQEAVVAGFCMLLVILWLQWAQHYSELRRLNIPVPNATVVVVDGELVNDVSRLFTYWQVCSVLLALGFLFFTNFFWTLVAKYGDQRYLLSALNAHIIWGVSWVFISLPLLSRWQYWNRVKRMALVELAVAESGPDGPTMKKDVVMATRPFSDVGLSISTLATVVSFVLPIVQLFTE